MDKLEKFLFDIFGLIMPGLVFLLVFAIISIVFIDIPNLIIPRTYILNNSDFNNYISTYFLYLLPFTFFICYLIGHVIKVLSKYQYDVFILIFDEGLNTIFSKICITVVSCSNSYSYLRKINNLISNIFKDIFCFKVEKYSQENEPIVSYIKTHLKKKYNINNLNEWNSLYKFSKIVEDQEGLKSLSYLFLSKYSAYRSLAFVFLSTQLYIILIIIFKSIYINDLRESLVLPFLFVLFIFWLTFHERYKYYYPLCGNETIMALYYYLKKEGK